MVIFIPSVPDIRVLHITVLGCLRPLPEPEKSPDFALIVRDLQDQNGTSSTWVAGITNFATTFLAPALSKAMSSLSPSIPSMVP